MESLFVHFDRQLLIDSEFMGMQRSIINKITDGDPDLLQYDTAEIYDTVYLMTKSPPRIIKLI